MLAGDVIKVREDNKGRMDVRRRGKRAGEAVEMGRVR
jgi:hypothetical protein